MMTKKWRFIFDVPLSVEENMCIDAALVDCFTKESLPIFRIYQWYPAGITIGRFQDIKDINLNRCSASRIKVVRRITGGGAIYHDNEIAYSITISNEKLFPKGISVEKAYTHFNSFLIKFYASLGLNTDFAVNINKELKNLFLKDLKIGHKTSLCFMGIEKYDIISLKSGKKIGGNAQRIKRGFLLQHGSIPIENSMDKALEYIKREKIEKTIDTCLHNEIKDLPPRERLIKKLKKSFIKITNAELISSKLTIIEEKRKNQYLKTGKFRII